MPRSLGKTDIRFSDPRMAALMLHVNRLTEELQKISALLDDGQPGQVLIKRTTADFDGEWGSAGGSGAGEANTAENVGEGAGIFRDKSGVTLNLRSLIGGAGIEIVVDQDVIRITSTDSAEQLEPLVIAGVFA